VRDLCFSWISPPGKDRASPARPLAARHTLRLAGGIPTTPGGSLPAGGACPRPRPWSGSPTVPPSRWVSWEGILAGRNEKRRQNRRFFRMIWLEQAANSFDIPHHFNQCADLYQFNSNESETSITIDAARTIAATGAEKECFTSKADLYSILDHHWTFLYLSG